MDDITVAGGLKATTIVLGISLLSATPVDADSPIAVGDNDPRIPTAGEKEALAGTGTPSASNKYVTEDDTNLTGNVKTSGNQTVNGIKTFGSLPVLPDSDPTTANQACRKAYVDGLAEITDQAQIDGFYYRKIGKFYFDWYLVSGAYKRVRASSAEINRLASQLGKTVDTSYTTINTANGTQGGWLQIWNGSYWTYSTDSASDYLLGFTVT